MLATIFSNSINSTLSRSLRFRVFPTSEEMKKLDTAKGRERDAKLGKIRLSLVIRRANSLDSIDTQSSTYKLISAFTTHQDDWWLAQSQIDSIVLGERGMGSGRLAARSVQEESAEKEE